MEGLRDQATQIACLCPLGSYAGQRVNSAVLPGEEAQGHSTCALCGTEEPRSGKDETSDAHADVDWIEKTAGVPALQIGNHGAQINEYLGVIDLDRANLKVDAAER